MNVYAITLVILLASCLSQLANGISMGEIYFQTEIFPNCYKLNMQRNLYLLGQSSPMGPSGQSMENFISLIEKIEDQIDKKRSGTTRPDLMARMLLSRFHIDDYNYYPFGGIYYQENVAATRNRLTTILLEANPPEPVSEEEWRTILTSDEKCSLYFMLSHHVNHTALPNDRRTYFSAAPTININGRNGMIGRANIWGQPNNMNGNGNGQTLMTEQGREYGVVGFRNHETHAIAPARVLMGIVAWNSGKPTASTGEVMKQLGLEINPGFKESQLNIPLIVTLGDIWAYGAAPNTHEEREGINFGYTGTWNSTLCQVEYKLETNYTKGSMAEIRGAIDGYLLGKKSLDVIPRGKFRLSSLLRQYYSTTGLFDEYASVCRRSGIMQETGELRSQVENYLPLLLRAARIPTDSNRVSAFVEKSRIEFERALNEAQMSPRGEEDWCQGRSFLPTIGSNNEACETPSDVVVVVDIETLAEDLQKQMEIVKELSNELDMGRYGSSMTIVAATRNGGYVETNQISSSDTLSKMAWNSTNRGCVSCRFAFADLNNFGQGFRNQPDQLLKYLNATLRDLKRGKEDMSLAPGRPVVFFNFGALKRTAGDRRSLEAARWDLMVNHRDVPLLLIGNGDGNMKEDMKYFAYDDKKDIFTADPDVRGVVQAVSRRICETPAVIQYPNCRNEPSSGTTVTGYVTRGRRQYYALYPEYFLKSYNIVFEFKASAPIKICYRRGYEKPEEDERNCEKLDATGTNSRIIRSANPCYKYTLADCPPFYFTIIAESTGESAQNKCYKEQCRNMNQIEWTMTHTGISCNSAATIFSSFLFAYLLSSIAYYRLSLTF